MTEILDIPALCRRLEGKALFLFDVDGTLAPTEPVHWQAYNAVLARQGIQLGHDDILRYMGNSEFRIYDMIRADHGATIDDQSFLEARVALFLQLAERADLQPFDYVRPVLEAFPNTPRALVTSQRREIVDPLLTRWGLDAHFPRECRISCIGGVSKADVYAEPWRYVYGFGACDGSCGASFARMSDVVVFEDSDRALAKAASLGLTTVGVRHSLNGAYDLGTCAIVGVSPSFS